MSCWSGPASVQWTTRMYRALYSTLYSHSAVPTHANVAPPLPRPPPSLSHPAIQNSCHCAWPEHLGPAGKQLHWIVLDRFVLLWSVCKQFSYFWSFYFDGSPILNLCVKWIDRDNASDAAFWWWDGQWSAEEARPVSSASGDYYLTGSKGSWSVLWKLPYPVPFHARYILSFAGIGVHTVTLFYVIPSDQTGKFVQFMSPAIKTF